MQIPYQDYIRVKVKNFEAVKALNVLHDNDILSGEPPSLAAFQAMLDADPEIILENQKEAARESLHTKLSELTGLNIETVKLALST